MCCEVLFAVVTYICIMSLDQLQPGLLEDLVKMRMPFGKYKDTVLCYLPVSYLEWFQKKGFPAGKLGMLLQTLYEIKINGLEYLLDPLKKK
jgi:uncharacterized protein (DUF3820 family)